MISYIAYHIIKVKLTLKYPIYYQTVGEVLNFLKQLNAEGNTIVMITHDNAIAGEAKRVVRIHDGKIIFDGSTEEYATKFQAGN